MGSIEKLLDRRAAEVDARLAASWQRLTKDDAQALLRRHPIASLGGGAAVGFLAARVLLARHRARDSAKNDPKNGATNRIMSVVRPVRALVRTAMWAIAMASPTLQTQHEEAEAMADPVGEPLETR